MKKDRITGFLLGATLCLALFPPTSLAARLDTEKYRIEAKKISKPLAIDGSLKEPVWQQAVPATDFVQTEPREGAPSSQRTEVRVLYDDQTLYFGVSCYDNEPDKIVSNEMRRDAELRNDDYFEIIIDTFHDHRNAFYFATNALGAQLDSLIRDEGANVNRDWDGIWTVRAQKNKQGWFAEIAIPFYTLRFKADDVLTWGINFGRHIARNKEDSYWTPVLRDYGWFGKLKISYHGHLTGLRGVRQGKRLQIMPYTVGGGKQDDETQPFRETAYTGLDLKYRLASDLTADITVNTDFAQVESDQERFNLTRFDLFFPEKREFFLEGADIFRFGERTKDFEHEGPSTLLFFSRTIGLSPDGREIPVLGGLKVTGKMGRYTLGILDILSDRLSYVEEGVPVDIQRTNFSLVRVKRDIFEKSGIGLIGLSKDSLSSPGSTYYNRAVGLDFNLAFGQSFQALGFLAKSFTQGWRGRDWAGSLDLAWEDDLWTAEVSYTDIGYNFNSEMGFIQRYDIRKFRLNGGVSPRPQILGLRQISLSNNFSYYENHAGQIQSRYDTVSLWNLFQNGSTIMLGYTNNYEFLTEAFEIIEGVFIPIGRYRFNNFWCFFHTDQTRRIGFSGGTDFGEFYGGRMFNWSTSGSFKLSRNFNLELSYNRDKFNLPIPGGKFTTNIAGTRLIYSFTPNLFAKAYVQWNDTERRFRSNFLIRWIYKPGANIYFIYNTTNIFGSNMPNFRGLRNYVEDRVVLLKVSFLFNY